MAGRAAVQLCQVIVRDYTDHLTRQCNGKRSTYLTEHPGQGPGWRHWWVLATASIIGQPKSTIVSRILSRNEGAQGNICHLRTAQSQQANLCAAGMSDRACQETI